MSRLISHRSVSLTALVAGVFSAIVGVGLLVDGAQRKAKVPMDSEEFMDLRKRFVANPMDEDIRVAIRRLDLTLRQDHFREQRFTELGAYLLLGGIATTLIFSKWAATMRRKLPSPKPKDSGPDTDEQLSREGPWAVAIVAIALAGTAWAMKAVYPTVLPTTMAELAALTERSDPKGGGTGSGNPTGGNAANSKPVIPELPSIEEFRRNWTSFRGPMGSGVSSEQTAPTEWDGATEKGILWKTTVPLTGLNSPITWNDRVFLSGASEDTQEVFCFDAANGKLLWQQEVKVDLLEDTSKVEPSEDTGFAAPTMATDGRLVFAMFAMGNVAAFDFSGRPVWQKSLGVPQRNAYGHSSSLVTHAGALIVQFDHGKVDDDLSKLVSLDGATGEIRWETPRKMSASWSSPIVIDYNDKPQIITCGDPWVIAYSPQDGKEIWRANCLERAEVGPSPVYSDGVVFAGNESAYVAAIGVDGSGDVTESHIKWTSDWGLPDTCSPLVAGEFVLTMTSFGTLSCFDKGKGVDPLWEEDFDTEFISSPSLVGDQIYLISKEGKTWIVKATREKCVRVTEADLGEACVTSPAFHQGRIYLRGSEHLFCIGKASPEKE